MAVAERWKGYKELPPNILNRLKKIENLCQQEQDIFLVYLFGSLTERKNVGDIDLAIFFSTKPSYERLSCITEKLYKLLGTQRIDIVDLRRASPVFKFDIISRGKLLYMKDVNILNKFELNVIKEHMDTKYLRKVQGWFLREKVLKKD